MSVTSDRDLRVVLIVYICTKNGQIAISKILRDRECGSRCSWDFPAKPCFIYSRNGLSAPVGKNFFTDPDVLVIAGE